MGSTDGDMFLGNNGRGIDVFFALSTKEKKALKTTSNFRRKSFAQYLLCVVNEWGFDPLSCRQEEALRLFFQRGSAVDKRTLTK